MQGLLNGALKRLLAHRVVELQDIEQISKNLSQIEYEFFITVKSAKMPILPTPRPTFTLNSHFERVGEFFHGLFCLFLILRGTPKFVGLVNEFTCFGFFFFFLNFPSIDCPQRGP